MHYGSVYTRNETMRLIGKQYLDRWYDEAAHAALIEIMEANNTICVEKLIKNTVLDAFIYGCIAGTRSEREARKKKKSHHTSGNLK